MEIFTVRKTTTFVNHDTKVKIEMSDGACSGIGIGKAECADGDDFDEEVGEEIASIRAKISAFDDMIDEHKTSIEAYQNMVDNETEQLNDLCRAKGLLENRLKQLIE